MALRVAALVASTLLHGSVGQDWFVSPTGDDSAAGTSPTTAWRTPQRAAAALENRPRPLTTNATIHIAPGLYIMQTPLLLGPATGGDDLTQVEWVGYGSDNAIFSGATPVPGPWEAVPSSPGVFSASLVGGGSLALVRRLYCPDESCARTGNGSLGPARQLASTPVLIHAGIDANTSCIVAAPGELDGLAPEAFTVAQLALWHAWATSVNSVVYWNASNRTLCAHGPLGDPYNPLAYAQSLSRYAVYNLQVGWGVRWPLWCVARCSNAVSHLCRIRRFSSRGDSFMTASTGPLSTQRCLVCTSEAIASFTVHDISGSPIHAGENPMSWSPGALLAETLPVVVDIAGARSVALSGNVSIRHAAANLEAYCISRGGPGGPAV